jgi:hypothetical protein
MKMARTSAATGAVRKLHWRIKGEVFVATLKRRPRRGRSVTAGDVFEIDLGDGYYAFGIVCAGNDCAFFDLRSSKTPSLEEILSHKTIFRIPVAKDAFAPGRWKVLGNAALRGALAEHAEYRNQPVGSNQLFLYRAGKFTPASLEDVKDLEPLAVWFDQHVEERLRDYFAHRPNRTEEYFKKIKRYDVASGQEIE